MLTMKKVCIAGYGAIGPIHAKALEAIERVQLYGVCDIDPDRRRLCREQYDVTGYEDFDAMLADTQIDSVHICTPHHLHYEMARKALAAGKSVVLEKPAARTRQEWNNMMGLKDADKVCLVLQNRLNPCVQRLRELISDGSLGNVKAARAVLTWQRDRAYYESADWRGRWSTEGGGLLINQAIHTLDFFSYLLGGIRKVRTTMCNHTLEGLIEVEDTLAAHLELAGGIRGVFFATNGYSENSSPFFEISFEKGIARYLDRKLWINGQMTAEDTSATVGKDYWGSGHSLLLRNFYEKGVYFSPFDVKNTMETVFAMYEDTAQASPLRPPRCTAADHNSD